MNQRCFKRLFAFALMLPLMVSCASGVALSRAKKQLKQGNAVGAVLYAVESVAKDAKNYKAVDYLASIYPDAVAKRADDADTAERGNAAYRLEDVVAALSDLHSMFDAVSRLPPVYRKKSTVALVFPVAYQKDRLLAAKQGAADIRYAEGIAFSSQGKRSSWREAHKRFVKTLFYVPGYRDAEVKANEARELGSDKVLVLPFGVEEEKGSFFEFSALLKDSYLGTVIGKYLSARGSGSGLSAELGSMLYGSYLGTLVTESDKESYVRVVERSFIDAILSEREFSVSALADGRVKLDSNGIQGANVIVIGQVSGIIAEQSHESKKTVELQATVEEPIKGATPVNGVIPTQKVVVYATVSVFTKTSSLTAGLSLRAVNAESALLIDAVSNTQTVRDTSEWASYTGDKRALTGTYQSLTEKREQSVRSPREMMQELSRLLVNPAISALLAKLPVD